MLKYTLEVNYPERDINVYDENYDRWLMHIESIELKREDFDKIVENLLVNGKMAAYRKEPNEAWKQLMEIPEHWFREDIDNFSN